MSMDETASDVDPMISWRQRKEGLKAAVQKRSMTTNAWQRLRREAQEAAQNPNNLHDGWTVRKGDKDA
jgi:hypothetical protein